ncbi:Holliday junction branch migration protein RuvA [Motilimonas cestriensis]|uniref:Holliday junction branch migration complex subunit RuvA n=1 Tax=Motilimonas cestriensis TaxID=2742685 RepID=A0ABS8WG67_9GAMM|nr:Holliday junction branch migration protein RuvA [Motilimonas cestriensis]
MIGRLRGILLEKQAPEILIEVSGVGYEVQLPMSSFYHLPEPGHEAVVYTHFVVREDAQLLYGFTDKLERAMFRELIKVNGVGPKLALAILSGMTANQFVQCIEDNNVTGLVKLPGVGKKTAERLLVEMKDRLKGWVGADLFNPALPRDEESVAVTAATDEKGEAIGALISLGYKPAVAEKMVKQVYREGASCESLIRDALRTMA